MDTRAPADTPAGASADTLANGGNFGHGSAYDIAGQGVANGGATRAAVLLAARMSARRHAPAAA